MEFFGEMPEELKKAMLEAHDQEHMARCVAAVNTNDFLNSMSLDHLKFLKSVLYEIAYRDDSQLAAYYQGLAVMAMQQRFNICIGCGEVHTPDELLEEK